MKLKHSSLNYKLLSLIRFCVFRIFYLNKKISFFGLIGSDNSLSLYGNVFLGGRLITGKNVDLICNKDASLIIGSNFCIGDYSRISVMKKVLIGDNVMIARFVSILDHDHKYSLKNRKLFFNEYESKEITLGNNVWVGDKVTILKGVTIGSNVIIGANSVVTKSIPSNCVAAGNPCKVIKTLDKE